MTLRHLTSGRLAATTSLRRTSQFPRIPLPRCAHSAATHSSHSPSILRVGADPTTLSETPAPSVSYHIPQPPTYTYSPRELPLISTSTLRPESVVSTELDHLKSQISLLLSSGYPGLDRTSKYYLQSSGKLFRPMVVFLMSRATSIAPKTARWHETAAALESTFNLPASPAEIIADTNPDLALLSSKSMPHPILTADSKVAVLGTQRRLAEIVELIHTASLLHDDVIDHADTRRGQPSANAFSGNKLSVLAGDYMFGRASVFLARLREPEVIELMATVMSELVKGELFQLSNTPANPLTHPDTYLQKSLDYYLQKTYLKTASLVSKSCRAAAVLGGATEEVAEAAYVYGKHMGLAFQLVDDVLDFEASGEELGKPAGADLELGLATAPVFFAWQEYRELGEMIERKFEGEGDTERARELVLKSNGIQRTKELAHEFCMKAKDAISIFPESEAREGLEVVLQKVLSRRK